jgi:lysophospholipase L1-like esterase
VTKHLDWVFAGLAVAAGYGLVRALRCEPTIRPGDTVFFVGDSLAVGLGPFFAKLAKERGVEFYSASKTGTMMQNWLQNQTFKEKLEQSRANVVMVCLGTNDAYSQRSATELRSDADAMLALARGGGRRKVLWILPPRLPKDDRATPAIRSTGSEVFESASLKIPMGVDQIHPTSTGYAMWAGLVWRDAAMCAGRAPALGAVVPLSTVAARLPDWLRASSSRSSGRLQDPLARALR